VAAPSDWTDLALTALRRAGFRAGGARRQVVELLGGEPCAVTALEIDRRLDGVGRASVYRALEQLEMLGLVHRVEVGGEAAAYERRDPDGDHHHHLVCGACGALVPFADERLEQAIESLGEGGGFRVESHEVVLRGSCGPCAEAAAARVAVD
jgi:Fur family transcriptional regulator, ferric uptake regulator